MTVQGKGGQPTREQKRAARIAALVERLANVDLDLAENALSIMEKGSASDAVRVQAANVLLQVRPRLESTSVTADNERAALADLAFKGHKLLIQLGLHGFPPSRPTMLSEPADLKTIQEAGRLYDERIAELSAKEAEFRERAERVERLEQHLEAVERRDLKPKPAPESAEDARGKAGGAATSPGIIPKNDFSSGDPLAPWNRRKSVDKPWDVKF